MSTFGQLCCVLVFFFSGFSSPVFSGSILSEIDSLKQLLSVRTDTARVRIMISIARATRQAEPDYSDSLFKSAIAYAISIGDSKGELDGYGALAVSFGMRNDYPEALAWFNKALEKAREYDDHGNIARNYNNLGILYKRIGDYTKSLGYYSQALELKMTNNDLVGIANSYSNLGVLSDLMDDFESSLNYYRQAISIYLKNFPDYDVSGIYQNIGVLYLKDEQYDSALVYLKKGLALVLRYHDDNSYEKANVMGNIGNAYIKMGRYELANEILMEALEVAEKIGARQEHANILYNLGLLHHKLGNKSKALDFALECARVADETRIKERSKDARELLAKLYEWTGDYEKALVEQKLARLYHDSLLNEQQIRDYENKRVQLEVYQKDRQLDIQKLEMNVLEGNIALEKQWKWALVIILSLLGVSLVLVFQKYTTRKKVNKHLSEKNELISNQKNEIEKMNRELEKRMLRAQLNPHFIFNALNSIQHFIVDNNKGSALKYLSKFSNLLRQVLESSVSLKLILAEDIRMLKIYIELEALKMPSSMRSSWMKPSISTSLKCRP
ncbi:MAG: tetratricopeptide repeat protein [Cyclobacteriaceae bacterium]|nr:tetratricopeptide repeat protein [Cyclobacteriaceae bacterium]